MIGHDAAELPVTRDRINDAYKAIWYGARLWPLLHSGQREVYARYYANPDQTTFCLDVARRWGKTTLAVVLALETALTRKGARITYGAPTSILVREAALPVMNEVLRTCPDELLPTFNKVDGKWTFPSTNAEIKMVGCDADPNRLRGSWIDFGVLDEVGFITAPTYVINDVLLPQTQQRPHARLLLCSTPPVSPAHDWTREIVPNHQAKGPGAYHHATIHDNPLLPRSEIERFVHLAGGEGSTTHKRENLAEHVIDETRAIIPEWRHVEHVCLTDAYVAPSHRVLYVGMDPGWDDLTVVLFAYWDFLGSKLVVEDEIALKSANSLTLATAIKEKERTLWGGLQPFKRVSDVEKRLVWDLHERGIQFSLAEKEDKDNALATLRAEIGAGRMVVHPRCKVLASTLANGVWHVTRNGVKTTFERTEELGHCDAIDALLYLRRAIVPSLNPYPPLQANTDLWIAQQPTHDTSAVYDAFRG